MPLVQHLVGYARYSALHTTKPLPLITLMAPIYTDQKGLNKTILSFVNLRYRRWSTMRSFRENNSEKMSSREKQMGAVSLKSSDRCFCQKIMFFVFPQSLSFFSFFSLSPSFLP